MMFGTQGTHWVLGRSKLEERREKGRKGGKGKERKNRFMISRAGGKKKDR